GIARARALSRATMRNIRQNLVLAFIYNVLGIPLAAGVLYPAFALLLSPIVAAAAIRFSSVSVIGNSLRLKFASVSAAVPSTKAGMTESIHPVASDHLPSFIIAHGETGAHGCNGHYPTAVRADGRHLVLSVACFKPLREHPAQGRVMAEKRKIEIFSA